MNWIVIACKLLALIGFALAVKRYDPNWASLDSRPLPSWFDQNKIGIFLHWGVFSVPSYGSEWFWFRWQGTRAQNFVQFMNSNYKPNFTYVDFAPQFTAEFYNPDQWADVFSASGARYVVLTSKHHEGFTLWPSKYSWNWNAADVGPRRDLLGELADAVRRKENLKFGIYHSLFEWFNPLYLQDKQNSYRTQDFVLTKSIPELKELINTYQPEVIWSDGDWEASDTYWTSTDFLAWLYNDSPVKDTVVTNDRWGQGTACKHGGYWSCQDRYNPGTLQPHKWENAMTLDSLSWGYRRDAVLSDYLTIQELLKTMAETISCGGNLLVNIGPTHDGRIAPIFEERLRQMGQWLAVNGEAIYESQPFRKQNDTVTPGVWYTQNGSNVYAIVLNWPDNSLLRLGAISQSEVTHIEMLGVKGNLSFNSYSSGGIVVQMPNIPPDSLAKWTWVLKLAKD